ncbi:MAG: DUF898 family protein, partial [Bradyrhizobium sp.]|nr:DUF898 family protein [Bradyrhizobium sp.]
DLRGDFEGRGWEFFKQAWYLWLIAPFAILLFPLLPFVYAQFKAVEWRWWLSGIRFGGVRLESSLPVNAFHGLYWKVIGWFILLSLVYVIYLGAVIALGMSLLGLGKDGLPQAQALATQMLLVVAMVPGYIALILAVNVVMRLYLVRDMWAVALDSVRVYGIEAMANVAAKGDLASALGEGFADGLDVAGF